MVMTQIVRAIQPLARRTAFVVGLSLTLLLATTAEAQRFGARGGGFAARKFQGQWPQGGAGGGEGGRFGEAAEGRFGGGEAQEGGFGGRLGERFGSGQQQGAGETAQGHDGLRSRQGTGEAATTTSDPGATYTNRRGGSVDSDKTTTGDTTDRSQTYTTAGGQSATHTGSVTKDDGNFDYSGSTTTSAGASTHGSASGTYSDGRIDSANTSLSGTNAAGVSGTHEGNWNRSGDTTSYYGSSSTSTGKWSESAGTVTKTDDGFVAHGATANTYGAGAGTVVKDGDQVYGRSVTTNYDTVTRTHTDCTNGTCYSGSVTTGPVTVQQYYAAPYYYYPQYYAYYACPPGSTTVVTGGAGTAVYSCGVTPMISATVPITMMAMAAAGHAKSQQASTVTTTAQVTSSPVVMYRVASDTVVYATSYQPQNLYWQEIHGRAYWVPGAATGTPDVKSSIAHASEMKTPTANATVITYDIDGARVYLTNEAPVAGVYSQRADVLYAWLPGVSDPTQAQRDTIATAVTAHRQGGEQALTKQVQQLEKARPAPG